MSKTYKIGDTLRVRIEKIVPRGFGISFAEGLTVLTPLTAPGDVVEVRLTSVKKRLAFAELVAVLEPGPGRTTPECPYFGTCGGCDFQQLDYATQVGAKVGIIQDCLRRITKLEITPEIAVVQSPKAYGYRSRARWHVEVPVQRLGYFRRDSHDLVDAEVCPILTPELETVMGDCRTQIGTFNFWEDHAEIDAAASDNGDFSIYSPDIPRVTEELVHRVDGSSWTYSARSFFQANRSLIGGLIETAIGGLSGDRAFDLYAGVGLFTLPLALRFSSVAGVEGEPIAAEFAQKNVNAAGLTNVSIERSSVGSFLRCQTEQNIDLILLDPPRSGTEKGVIERIAELSPRHISYVSCEPSMLARDLRPLLDAGYEIVSLTAVDLFPQTHHVETVAVLRSADKGVVNP